MGNLVLSRKLGEEVIVQSAAGRMTICYAAIRPDRKIRLAFHAPPEILIYRAELAGRPGPSCCRRRQELTMPPPPQTGNRFLVGANGESVVIQNAPALSQPLSRDDALLLAAWLILVADPTGEKFHTVLLREKLSA